MCTRRHTHNLYFSLCHQPQSTHLAASPLLTSFLNFPFSGIRTFIDFYYSVEEQKRICFSLPSFDTRSACPCIRLAASCHKWTLHTATGLTLRCWAHSLHTEVRLPSCMQTHSHMHQHRYGHRNGRTCESGGNAYPCAQATPGLSDFVI